MEKEAAEGDAFFRLIASWLLGQRAPSPRAAGNSNTVTRLCSGRSCCYSAAKNVTYMSGSPSGQSLQLS